MPSMGLLVVLLTSNVRWRKDSINITTNSDSEKETMRSIRIALIQRNNEIPEDNHCVHFFLAMVDQYRVLMTVIPETHASQRYVEKKRGIPLNALPIDNGY
jgi:hypothetical protein